MGNNYTVVNHPQIIRERMDRLPIGISILVLCVVGIVGNSLVLHIFRKIQQNSINSAYMVFVCMLAFLDLTTSIAHLAKELANLVFTTHDDSDIECRITYYCGFIVGSSSSFVVSTIVWERYRKICHPLKPQMNVSSAKRACILCLLVSIVTGLPFPFAMGNWYKKLDGQNTVKCLLGNSGEPKVWPFIYFISYFIAAVVMCFIAAGFQIIIWKRILAQKSARKRMKLGQNFKEKKQLDSSQQNSSHHYPCDNSLSVEIEVISNSGEHYKDVNKKAIYMIDGKIENKKGTIRKPVKDSEQSAGEDNVKITLTFCIITFLLIISYVPHLAFYAYVAFENYFEPSETIARSTYTIYSILPDFVAINGILNPFVYFFNDKKFRDMLKVMICHKNTLLNK